MKISKHRRAPESTSTASQLVAGVFFLLQLGSILSV